MKRLAPFLFLLLFSHILLAQNADAPKIKYRAKNIVEMSDMLGKVDYMRCETKTRSIVGTIVKRNFEDNELTIAGIIIRSAKDKRTPININSAKVGLLGKEAPTLLSNFLEKNKKVQVWFNECSGGGSGVFYYADRIKAL